MTTVPQTPVAMLDFDLISAQGKAIAARLQTVFPPSLFQFKYLPPNPGGDRKAWASLVQGNQPFLGLGFVGVSPVADNPVFNGIASWMLLLAVRQAAGTPKTLFFGDAQGIGVLKMGFVATAILQGFNAATGAVSVAKMSNAISDAWSDDSAVLGLDLRVPLTIKLSDAIAKPGDGLFEELNTIWNVPVPNGSQDIYSSDWENPNV
jgi:hypothetical protein